MSNVCSAANLISTYTPSAAGSEISLLSKNVDAVTVEANLVACNALTIQGVVVDTSTSDKIQNISSATAGVTNFTGEVTMTDLSANQIETDTIIPKTGTTLQITDAAITSPLMHFAPTTGRVGINYNNPQQALDIRANISQTSAPSFCVDATNSRIGVGVTNPTYSIQVNNSATSSTNLMALLQPSLPVSAYSQFFVGKDTSKNMGFRYTTSSTDTATSNYGGIFISGTETSRWYQSSIELRQPVTMTGSLYVQGEISYGTLNFKLFGQTAWTTDPNKSYYTCNCPFARSVTFGFQDMYATNLLANGNYVCAIRAQGGIPACQVWTVGTNGGAGRDSDDSNEFFLHNAGPQSASHRMAGSITLTRMYTPPGAFIVYNVLGNTILYDVNSSTTGRYFSNIVGRVVFPANATLSRIELLTNNGSTGMTGTFDLSYIL